MSDSTPRDRGESVVRDFDVLRRRSSRITTATDTMDAADSATSFQFMMSFQKSCPGVNNDKFKTARISMT